MPRLAIAQLRPTKGDYNANLQKIGGVLAQVAKLEPPVDLVVFPETVTSGYFVEGGVRDVAVTAGTLLRDLTLQHEAAQAPPVDVAVGVCEDAWHSLSGTIAALQGAQLVIVPSASPARGTGMDEEGIRLPASVVRWERILRGMADEHGVWVAFASLVGFEGGKGFPGGSVVVSPAGDIVLRGPLFEEAVLTYDVDFEEITRARAEAPLLADLEVNLPHLIKNLGMRDAGGGKRKRAPVKFDPATNGAIASRISHPASRVHVIGRGVEEGDPLAIDPDLARRWLTSFLKDEVVRRRGFTKGIVGLSGGVDSSLTAFLAVEALGKENVIGVRMPYRTSSPE